MAAKTLRIIFTGIVTLTPGPPEDEKNPRDKAFVMMAANVDKNGHRGEQVNDLGVPIAEHFPFVLANRLTLDNPPQADDGPGRYNGGDCIYYLKDTRVKIEPPSSPKKIPLKYSTDSKPMGERPGSADIAPASDIRWLADLSEIFPADKRPKLKKTVDPSATYVSEEVAVIVDLSGGELKASFPCDTLNPHTFIDKDNKVVPKLRRVLASEFTFDIQYPEDTKSVTLSFEKLRKGTAVDGPQGGKLVVKWPAGRTIVEVRMGNDTKEEVRRLNTPQRCDPARQTGPVLKPRDDEFDLHYNLLEIPPKLSRPLPSNDPHQCSSEGCKPMIVNPGG
jgi:hypothetical protein